MPQRQLPGRAIHTTQRQVVNFLFFWLLFVSSTMPCFVILCLCSSAFSCGCGMPCALEGNNGRVGKRVVVTAEVDVGCNSLQLSKSNRCKQAKSDGSLFGPWFLAGVSGKTHVGEEPGWASLLVLRREYSQMDGRQVPLVGRRNGCYLFQLLLFCYLTGCGGRGCWRSGILKS